MIGVARTTVGGCCRATFNGETLADAQSGAQRASQHFMPGMAPYVFVPCRRIEGGGAAGERRAAETKMKRAARAGRISRRPPPRAGRVSGIVHAKAGWLQ